MHLNISQQMKMGQTQIMAPRMIQSMEILQLNMMALNERIEQELVENVTLELLDKKRDEPFAESDRIEVPSDKNEARELNKDVEQRELVNDNDKSNESDFERLLEISSDWPEDNVSFGGAKPSANQVADSMDRQHDAMANMTARPQSLHEYLLEQLSYHDVNETDRQFAEYLIQHLDHNGRLQSLLAEICQQFNRVFDHNIDIGNAEAVLEMIQRFDPPGVGARDQAEMLLLQITDRMPFYQVMRVLVRDHLEDIAYNRLPVIQKATGYTIDMINVGIEQVQTLNPYPGRGFEQRPVQRVTPDLVLEKDDGGNWVVRLLDEYVPELRISPRYLKMLQENPTAETREWIKKKVESAKWLIDSIEQRYSTVKKVAQEIINHQSEFIEKGPEFIAPLKMQQIADKVGVHVTTISRAVVEKWIQTPRGLYPLRRFFGAGTQTADGEDVAFDAIRIKLQELIDNEDKSKPLSDEDLVKGLAEKGLKLARRTITKYRKQMNIPSSRQRREY